MFLTRVLGRTLLAAAQTETSAASVAAASTSSTIYNPLEQFFEVDRKPDDDKPVVYGIGLSESFPNLAEAFNHSLT